MIFKEEYLEQVKFFIATILYSYTPGPNSEGSLVRSSQ